MLIKAVSTRDARFQLEPGAGSDAVHSSPEYSFAVTYLTLDSGLRGTGLVLTMGEGNDLVCGAIEKLASRLVGSDIEELMAGFGEQFRALADDPHMRWLGPHKGVVHLALASITNAYFDLWAKVRKQPLWSLLLSLSPDEVVNLLDLSYLEDVLDRKAALRLLKDEQAGRDARLGIIERGYPGYDTSVGWYHYDDDQIRDNVQRSLDQGFGAFKLKVGGTLERDLQRAQGLRRITGPNATIMLDANQQWSLPSAITACKELASMDPYWIEEPTHPDDIFAHKQLAREIAPLALALGEHVPNRVVFKNYLEAKCVSFLQPDCTRLGGVSEFLTVSLLARKYGVPVVPHVGDMGQIHQHLVLFNHIAMGHPEIFLEHIPHLKSHFVNPAEVSGGRYRTPQEPGSSSDLL
ncbi:enolase C-terminal domain-like protein [Alloacidobacterium sp.]|uniref:enolase C-terminal domain-like protein n=1 Tax=Alloacidobacterium sp. TaxID=2951999 RepID=UPI002D3A33D2|nr:enolase C-terminal domain-like protein [Alloacidobacterium sp.]HYK37822.1 enolase C-terminal domain-like protein [Alloacidobacterium sp.]